MDKQSINRQINDKCSSDSHHLSGKYVEYKLHSDQAFFPDLAPSPPTAQLSMGPSGVANKGHRNVHFSALLKLVSIRVKMKPDGQGHVQSSGNPTSKTWPKIPNQLDFGCFFC